MHLIKEPVPKPSDRRTTAININYLAGDTDFDHRLKERRSSPGTTHQLLRSRQSLDSLASNGSTIPHHFRQQQQQQKIVRKSMNDVRYCLQKISIV
jgi:hypothetical protein